MLTKDLWAYVYGPEGILMCCVEEGGSFESVRLCVLGSGGSDESTALFFTSPAWCAERGVEAAQWDGDRPTWMRILRGQG